MRLVLLTLVSLVQQPAAAQAPTPDTAGVRRAALDYIEAFYEGDSTKIARSVRTDVRKIGFYRGASPAGAGGPYSSDEMPFPAMLEYIRNFRRNNRTTPATAPREVIVGEVNDQTATAKVVAWWGIDYLQFARYDGRWMIVNVLWQSPPPRP
jgi:hypothetical protein